MKYKFYTNGKNKVVATTTFSGKTIRGVAKCSQEDTFSYDSGIKLAKARCAAKEARAYKAKAQKRLNDAKQALEKAEADMALASKYFDKATASVEKADAELEEVLKSL